ncbi:amidase [Falsiroseomonas sp. HW251]|uniref:amidase n=1 Tax=Falsiroseomonas sp. HW251 TaxID=3390998 RepID=UPI003D312B6F
MIPAERLLQGGVRDAAAAIARGEVTARALVAAALGRSAALNGTLRAFAEIWPDAEARPGGGHLLAGLPVAHKDIFARPHRQPLCGAARPFAGPPLPPSPALAAVQATGAAETGVLTMAEFALGTTGTNAVHGDAGNPWAIGRCSGASSSGSAVAVAAGLVFASLGTDSGASCRLPASFCGVVGVKPSPGAVPTDGVFPMSWSLDAVGMLARGLDDAAILLAAARGEATPDAPIQNPALRIGIPAGYYTDHLHRDVAGAWDQGRRRLEHAGHRVLDVPVVETPAIRSLMRLVMRAEAAALHRPLIAADPGNYPLSVRRFLASGEATLATDYLDALRARGAMLRQALATTFARVDVLLTPTVPVLPPLYAEIADAADPEAWRRVTLLAHATQPASFLGLPAISVPAALTPDGLPIGLQLIGRPGEDAALFRAALPIEAALRAATPLSPSLSRAT